MRLPFSYDHTACAFTEFIFGAVQRQVCFDFANCAVVLF